MKQPSKAVVIITGVLALLTVIIIVLMAGLMYALDTPLTTSILIGSSSIVPLLVVIACFLPRQRTLALRILGSMVCLVCIGTLYQTVFGDAPDNGPKGRRIGTLATIIVASGLMAWRGRWPGADKEQSKADELTAAEKL